MKIILSRKGFYSSVGGYPSPHFVENGSLLSFPIPEENNDDSINMGRTYADLRFDDKSSYLDIMKQLGLNKFDGKYVHLDPDINVSVVNSRHSDWRGLFGQCSIACPKSKRVTIRENKREECCDNYIRTQCLCFRICKETSKWHLSAL